MRATLFIAALLTGACQEYDLKSTIGPIDEPVDTGTFDPAPRIEVSPVFVEFGALPMACQSDPEIVTIRNIGNSDLDVNQIDLVAQVGAYTQLGEGPVTLAPGEAFEVAVWFAPPARQRYEDWLRVHSNDPVNSSIDVSLAGEGSTEDIIVQPFEQVNASAVDVLFVIDNSCSMGDEINQLRQSFSLFIQQFVSLGLDYQIGVVTTDMDDPSQSGRLVGPIVSNATPDPVAQFRANADVGTSGSADERGLDAAYAALNAPLINNENAGLLRTGTTLSIVVVTDEDDSSTINRNAFSSWLNGLQGDPALTSLSVVGGPASGSGPFGIPLPCGGIFAGVSAVPVPGYYQVAQATGGVHADICQMDFNTILTQLAVQAAGFITTVSLDDALAPGGQITITINGVNVPVNPNHGFTYDAATNTVSFNGAAIPQPGDVVEIRFPVVNSCPN